MKIDISTVHSDYSGYSAIASIADQTKELWAETIVLDFARCGFFDANMSAALYTVVARLRDEFNTVELINLNGRLDTILRKNHFLTQFQLSTLLDTNQTTIPFKIFKLQAGEQFNEYLEAHMHGKGIPVMSEALTKRFRQSLFEIFQNAAIHSKSDHGVFSCGQFYPNEKRLDFTITDSGVGIRENVRRFMGNITVSSIDAIKWALTEGHSTKTGDQPGGLGLKLLKEFIGKNKGKLQIVSRYGYYQFSAGGEVYKKLDNDFPGTCLNIEVNTQDTSSYCLKSELSSDDIF